MITKKIIMPLIAVIIVAGISGVVAAKKTADSRVEKLKSADTISQSTDMPDAKEDSKNEAQQSNDGRYIGYSKDKISDSSYTTTILFFHAAWCPECRSFKNAINASTIPPGIQVLEVDYDKAADLKKQHGVTLQSTFVKVDQNGAQISKWSGYGKDKSLQSILKNL